MGLFFCFIFFFSGFQWVPCSLRAGVFLGLPHCVPCHAGTCSAWILIDALNLLGYLERILIPLSGLLSWKSTFFFFMKSCDFIFYFSIYFFSWRIITLQYCSGFCHTLTWNSHGFTCVPHPDPPSHLPLHPLPLGFPSAQGPSACLMHPTWAGDLFHPR